MLRLRATSCAALVVLVSISTIAVISPRWAAAVARPNIVVIMSDDQRWDTVDAMFMPRLSNRMIPGSNAVYIRDAFVSNPLCCPSRVTTLTGKYSDTSGVYSNAGTFTSAEVTGGGGFLAFDDDPSVNPTIATDLQGAGYRTALIGKYLNGYPNDSNWTYVPPGWDRWFSIRTGAYYRYTAASNGRRRDFGGDPSDYSTRVLSERATTFIRNTEGSGQPFFLYFSPTAPHAPATADARDVGRFDDWVDAYRWPASVGEPDVSDKPAYIKTLTWSRTLQRRYDAFHAAQLNATFGVDRAVAKIWDALPGNSVVLYMSDNGYEWGEHRWDSKIVPYNESIRVPMIIATKGQGAPTVDPNRIGLNVDVRATLDAFAGLSPTTMGHDWTSPSWARTDFVLEHWRSPDDVPTYCGVRSKGWMYVKYSTGEEELYDERSDPLELTNLVSEDLPVLSAARTRAGTLCRQGTIYPPDWPF
jgi:arylsulfatase A-like enzyme